VIVILVFAIASQVMKEKVVAVLAAPMTAVVMVYASSSVTLPIALTLLGIATRRKYANVMLDTLALTVLSANAHVVPTP
jgi:hypothetical protein